mmetsp:Transcript_57156/g.134117  ORF Transcript_57156/g.134117 Transcript_57156/m.134117 type:complete len:217 (-) Transcript_57156:140-790(-)
MSAAASDSGDKKRKRADTPSPTQVLEFLKICGKLKKTARTGWVRCGVAKHESVADHSWRMGVLPMLLSDVKGIDATRCMKIGLVHDLAEALVGDITPHCGVTKEEKSKLEADAMARIRSSVGESAVGEEIVSLWEEYEAGETAEARTMRQSKAWTCLSFLRAPWARSSTLRLQRGKRRYGHRGKRGELPSHEPTLRNQTQIVWAPYSLSRECAFCS